MLGPVGKLAKSALESAGYNLTRPTEPEKRLTRSYWADWFSRDPSLFARIYEHNRKSLSRVPDWSNNIDNSLWRYGVMPMWTGALNQIEPEVTYSDLIGFIASQIDPLKYLEIGVSVGKNFWQVANLFPDAEIYGLDVEEPSPALISLFDRVETVFEGPEQTVDTLSGIPKTIRLTHYRLHRKGVPVTYIKGDQFDPRTWQSIHTQFNFVFSDAHHSGHALRDEMRHLLQCDLLDLSGKFAMYWDDLVNIEMQSAFEDNCKALGGDHGLYFIHGTYGHKRLNGLVDRMILHP